MSVRYRYDPDRLLSNNIRNVVREDMQLTHWVTLTHFKGHYPLSQRPGLFSARPLFGPKPDLSRRLIQALELAARSSAVRSVARVSLRRFVQNTEVLQGENYFVKVANIWQGKAAGVLLRANVEDE